MTTKTTKLQKKTLYLIEQINTVINETTIKQTLRQIFYRLVSKLIVKTGRASYQKVSETLTKGRKQGLIPTDKIIDPDRYRSLREYYYETPEEFYKYKTSYEALKDYLTGYYIHKWNKQPKYIEIWTEKGALRTVFEPITRKYGVSFIVTKGYSSYTILLEASKRIKEECKERGIDKATILYFGDYDPSGKNIVESIKKELKKLQTSFDLKEIALNKQQIEYFDLPEIPLNKRDKRYTWFVKNYGMMGCELDALEVEVLQGIIEKAILEHYDLTISKEVESQRQVEISKMVLEAEKLLTKAGVEQ